MSEDSNQNFQELIASYEEMEQKFIEYLNENRENDEARLVPVVEEHYWQMAWEKLKDQGRNELAEDLYYEVDKKFRERKIGFKKVYEHIETGERVEVTYSDIIRYGNKYVWKDLGL